MNENYFMQMAAIAATLLGLSFLALTFFIGGLDRRYNGLSLPVFLHEAQRKFNPKGSTARSLPLAPGLATDLQLFDGDPVVVFLAYSTSVSWNLYFLALIVSLTVLDSQLDLPWLITVELVAFWGIILYSVLKRHRCYLILNTYRTADERFWTVGECLTALILTAAMLMSVYTACSASCGASVAGICGLAAHNAALVSWESEFLFTLKGITLGAVCLGLYVTNKDLFVFFKARTSDEIRKRWLETFIEDYDTLARRVDAALAGTAADAASQQALRVVWNGGMPEATYIRPEFQPSGVGGAQSGASYWSLLLRNSPKVASWMFDVPGIAQWVDDVAAQVRTIAGSEADAVTAPSLHSHDASRATTSLD